jgi:2-oxoglutarate ferredoxin oxidoreductase subunit delta
MSRTAPGGLVVVHEDECKGCALCVESCPVHGLAISATRLNRIGYHPVEFLDCGCTGCGVCFYACPEPGALRVVRQRPAGSARAEGSVQPALPDEAAPGTGARAGNGRETGKKDGDRP